SNPKKAPVRGDQLRPQVRYQAILVDATTKAERNLTHELPSLPSPIGAGDCGFPLRSAVLPLRSLPSDLCCCGGLRSLPCTIRSVAKLVAVRCRDCLSPSS